MGKQDKDNSLNTLHRYYIWANGMRFHFDTKLNDGLKKQSVKSYEIEIFMYMSLWYACLYVVIEGWRKLKIKDKEINKLLNSPNVELLKLYRHGVFHFHEEYYDKKFRSFMQEGLDTVEWIRALNRAFGRYFLTKFKHRTPERFLDPNKPSPPAKLVKKLMQKGK